MSCEYEFEKIRSFSDSTTPICPSCENNNVERKLGVPAIHFKGSGWYINDSKSSDKKGTNGSDSSSDDGTSSESKSEKGESSSSDSPSKASSEKKSTEASKKSTGDTSNKSEKPKSSVKKAE